MFSYELKWFVSFVSFLFIRTSVWNALTSDFFAEILNKNAIPKKSDETSFVLKICRWNLCYKNVKYTAELLKKSAWPFHIKSSSHFEINSTRRHSTCVIITDWGASLFGILIPKSQSLFQATERPNGTSHASSNSPKQIPEDKGEKSCLPAEWIPFNLE